MKNNKSNTLIGILVVILFFIIFSFVVQMYIDVIIKYIGDGFRGMLIYVLVSIITIVLAPVSTLPLIAVASNIWGGFVTGILNVISWTIGAMIAFALGRKFGVRFVEKVISLEKLYKIEKKIPKKNLFFGIIILRMIVPVDLLSYALGIFSKVRIGIYFWATFLGVIPFAFIFGYLGIIPFNYQIFGFGIFLIILIIMYLLYKIISKKNKMR